MLCSTLMTPLYILILSERKTKIMDVNMNYDEEFKINDNVIEKVEQNTLVL